MVYQTGVRNLVLLLNPLAGRNQREGGRIVHLAHSLGIEVSIVTSPAEVCQAFKEAVSQKKVVLVSGGDGTIAMVLTLYEKLRSKPLLSFLPGGTTNLIAKDLSSLSQEEILKAVVWGSFKVVRRKILKLWPPGVCGMFLGGGIIMDGVELFRKRRLLKGEGSFLFLFLPLFWRILSKRTKNPILKIEARDHQHHGPFWLLWVTTLQRIFGFFDPFLHCEGLKAGAISDPFALLKPKFLSSFFRERTLPFGGKEPLFFCTPKLTIYTNQLALDGEIYTSPSGRFLVEEAGEVALISC